MRAVRGGDRDLVPSGITIVGVTVMISGPSKCPAPCLMDAGQLGSVADLEAPVEGSSRKAGPSLKRVDGPIARRIERDTTTQMSTANWIMRAPRVSAGARRPHISATHRRFNRLL